MGLGGLRIVGGSLRNRRLKILPGSRPTSERAREALFDILGPWIAGKSVLELYAGSGAVSFEALSRGAASATAVDTDVSALEANRGSLDGELEILRETSASAVSRLAAEGRRFDFIFADPPYGQGAASVLPPGAELLAPGGTFVVQTDEEQAGDAPPGLVLTRVAAYGRNVFSLYCGPGQRGPVSP